MKSLGYVLDANIFIEAHRHYYAFDLVPRFWEALASSDKVFSIDRINGELAKGKDDLRDWARKEFRNSFLSSNDEKVFRDYSEIMVWVNGNNQFNDSAKADFAKGADGWLVAYARAYDYVVVTREQFSQDVKRNVPIPNICRQFNVRYTDTFTMLRELGIRLA